MTDDASCYWPRALLFVPTGNTRRPATQPDAGLLDLLVHFTQGNVTRDRDGLLADLTHCQANWGAPAMIGEQLLARCADLESVSAMGMAVNRYHARYAAGLAGPGELRLLPPWNLPEEFTRLPVATLLPLTPQEQRELNHFAIHSCGDLLLSAVSGTEPQLRRLRDLCAGRIEASSVVSDGASLRMELVLPPNTHRRSTLRRYLRRCMDALDRQLEQRLFSAAGCRLTLYPVGDAPELSESLHPERSLSAQLEQLVQAWNDRAPVARIAAALDGLAHRYGQLDLFAAQGNRGRLANES